MVKEIYNEIDENDFTPSNVYSEKILISTNTIFKEKVGEFLSNLNEKYIDFKKRLKSNESIWEKFKEDTSNKGNVHIEPEQVSIKSPTTILNAPWGTGKTYFIEQIALNWNDEEIKKKRGKFENFIVIDTWKFTTIPDIISAIIKNIYVILCEISSINSQNKEHFKKIKNVLRILFFNSPKYLGFLGEICYPNAGLFNLGILTSGILKEINESWNTGDDLEENFLQDLDDINNNIKPTIIVFDNTERMGIHSWEIIKTIQQLSIFKKLLFLLPINKTQLIFGNNIEYERKNESAIDKYITLGTYFDLQQDYLGILNELNFDENDAQLINKILNVQIKGYNLSIRLVERAFLNNKIKESFDINKYEGLKLIRKIWNANIINEIIMEDINQLKENYIYLFSFFNDRNRINYNSIENIEIFFKENKENEYLELNDINKNFFNEFMDIINKFVNRNNDFLTYINHDWMNEWNLFINNLKDLKTHLIEKNEEFNKIIEDNSKKIQTHEKNNEEIQRELNENIKELNELIDKKNNQGAKLSESKKHADLTQHISIEEQDINKNEEIINNLSKKNKEFEDLKNKINNLTNNRNEGFLDIFICEFENFYEHYNTELTKLINDKNKSKMMIEINQIVNLLKINYEHSYSIDDILDNEELKEMLIKKLS